MHFKKTFCIGRLWAPKKYVKLYLNSDLQEKKFSSEVMVTDFSFKGLETVESVLS